MRNTGSCHANPSLPIIVPLYVSNLAPRRIGSGFLIFNHFGIGLLDEHSDLREHFASPITQLADSRVYQSGSRACASHRRNLMSVILPNEAISLSGTGRPQP